MVEKVPPAKVGGIFPRQPWWIVYVAAGVKTPLKWRYWTQAEASAACRDLNRASKAAVASALREDSVPPSL